MKASDVPQLSRVVIKLHDEHVLERDEVHEELKERRLLPVDKLRERFDGLRLLPLERDRAQTRRLIEKAQAFTPDYRPPSFGAFVVALLPERHDPAKLVRAVRRHDSVERVYHAPPGEGASTSWPYADGWLPQQHHLHPAAVNGVDAVFAWGYPGGLGEETSFVDIEVGGWDLSHLDLGTRITRIGTEDGVDNLHGTKVLGAAIGGQNDECGLGVAPNPKNPRFSSVVRTGFQDVGDTIARCVLVMNPGDVLLVEMQQPVFAGSPKYPVEVLHDVYLKIQAAIAAGIIVVECAGNSNVDLDLYQDSSTGHYIFDPASPNYQFSGAIMVGGGNSVDLGQSSNSNYGKRIDAFAWADNVMTAYTAPDSFDKFFGGTSAAGAIVAGACTVLQSIRVANGLGIWGPSQMRAALMNPAYTTPSLDPTNDKIGRQPDLKKLIEDGLGLAPGDVYARDHLADLGLPHGGPIASSPDILHTPTPPADPHAEWGEGSGHENDYVGGAIDGSTDRHLYVRVRNRGGVAAKDVRAKVFWSEVGTLVLPSSWHEIGEASLAEVPAGDSAHVLGPIVWPSADIPAAGHYCFVALVGAHCDDMPDPAAFATWDAYKAFIRDENNATWRNFNVETVGAGKRAFRLPFFGAGAPDRAIPMTFEVDARLPPGARVALHVPPEIERAFVAQEAPSLFDGRLELPPKHRVRIVRPQGLTRLGRFRVPANRRFGCTLYVELPDDMKHRGFVSVVQRDHENDEVGRVSWRFDRGCEPRAIPATRQ